jgi:cytochrome c oxidase subunit 2
VSNKWWSVLFGVMMLACLLLFIIAPFVGWWLPKNVSIFGGDVDGLFYLILWITGFFFVLTEAILVYFMYRYAERPAGTPLPATPSFFDRMLTPVRRVLHNQHRVEVAWTIIPAAILLFIAFAQINVWASIKNPESMPAQSKGDLDQTMVVSARMFDWKVRYQSPDVTEKGETMLQKWARNESIDDIRVWNEVHTWKGAKVKVFLKTKDVIHSFYLPNLRLKQDALPGKVIPVWFQVTDYNTARNPRTGRWEDSYDPASGKFLDPAVDSSQVWELACAELCGWGHYKMHGKLYVHKNEDDYKAWLVAKREEQHAITSTQKKR